MSDVSITDLIAESHAYLAGKNSAGPSVVSEVRGSLVSRLTVALEAVTIASESEREELKATISGAVGGGNPDVRAITDAVDAVLARGFRLPVPVEPETPERFPESTHVEAKYWAELVKARRRITELEAVAAGWEYGVERSDGKQFACDEVLNLSGKPLSGWKQIKRIPAGPWLPVEPVQVDPQPHDPTQVTEGGNQ